MTRKIISAILALILCFSLAVSVSAEGAAFIMDEIGYLDETELDLLNEQAQAIYEETGVGIFYIYTTADDIENLDVSGLTGGMEDYVIMIENAEYWYTYYGGIAVERIDAATEEMLRDVYDQTGTYIEGVSEFLDAAAECFHDRTGVTDTAIPESSDYHLYDEADLLSDAEEAELTAKLEDASDAYGAQIVICTIASMDGGDIDGYLEYLYDTMGFGYGENHDGVLLLVCMDPREYRILSNGYAGTAIDTDNIASIGEVIVPDLSDGNYAESFTAFVEQCEYYLDGYINGFPFDFGKSTVRSLIIGIVAGLIVAFLLKSQLKSVHKQDRASAYVKQNSMNLTYQSDIFLYRTVSRTKKSSSDSSSGGGSSRSTGGGSF